MHPILVANRLHHWGQHSGEFGGVHCLKYGLTTNNVLGLEMVMIDGEIIRLGGKHLDSGGYDILGVLTGSEGCWPW